MAPMLPTWCGLQILVLVVILLSCWQRHDGTAVVVQSLSMLPPNTQNRNVFPWLQQDLEDGTSGDDEAGSSKKKSSFPAGAFQGGGSSICSTYHTSNFGARQDHPTSYDPSPSFLGPLRMERWATTDQDDDNGDDGSLITSSKKNKSSFHLGRERIRHYYERRDFLLVDKNKQARSLKPSSPTKQKLQAIVDHLAYHNAPIDVKEVCESFEFVLRTRKRLLGAAKKQQQQQQQQIQRQKDKEKEPKNGMNPVVGVVKETEKEIHMYDLCCGHGLTGMLFACCGDGGGISGNLSQSPTFKVILVDQTEPPSHKVLLELLTQVCPWIADTITFQEMNLDSRTAATLMTAMGSTSSLGHKDDDDDEEQSVFVGVKQPTNLPVVSPLVISTHACGSLTDRVLELGCASQVAAVAVMPCCYTGTSRGTPYGIQRALGVAWAADIQRSYYLRSRGYHSDFCTIPREVTPMNRILLGEYQTQTKTQ